MTMKSAEFNVNIDVRSSTSISGLKGRMQIPIHTQFILIYRICLHNGVVLENISTENTPFIRKYSFHFYAIEISLRVGKD